MLKEFVELRDLFEINAARQAEMDALFDYIWNVKKSNFPTADELTLLHDIAEHSVPEAQALYQKIDDVLNGTACLPKGMLGKMLMHRAQLPDQIVNDQKMKAYLETEHPFLIPIPQHS